MVKEGEGKRGRGREEGERAVQGGGGAEMLLKGRKGQTKMMSQGWSWGN